MNNVPSKIAFASSMEGRLEGHRNVHVLAVDCFAPKPTKPLYFPIQQVVRSNVQRAQHYADTWISLSKTLSPLNLVPSSQQISEAGRWAMRDLRPHLAFLERLCAPIEALED